MDFAANCALRAPGSCSMVPQGGHHAEKHEAGGRPVAGRPVAGRPAGQPVANEKGTIVPKIMSLLASDEKNSIFYDFRVTVGITVGEVMESIYGVNNPRLYLFLL